jgi:hypothetical protein
MNLKPKFSIPKKKDTNVKIISHLKMLENLTINLVEKEQLPEMKRLPFQELKLQ